MTTLLAFLVTLGVLITIHEYGHYRVARACGVKVLKFSVGFGKTLWSRTDRHGTEFAVSWLPLGGYVRMLDEREAPVPEALRAQAFNTQPVSRRMAIVAAGPAANLLLAVLLYAGIAWNGMQEFAPVIAQPPAGSIAEQAGLHSGQQIVSAQVGSAAEAEPVLSLQRLQWTVLQAAMDEQDVQLQVREQQGGDTRTLILPLAEAGLGKAEPEDLQRIGLGAPWMAPVVGEIVPDKAAERAGLRQGDIVLSVDDTRIRDAMQLRMLIRDNAAGQVQRWQLRRDDQLLELELSPDSTLDGEQRVGQIGAYLGAPPAISTIRLGPLEGLAYGIERTWDVSLFSLRMMGRMITGQASLQNISGPLSIAEFAGRSAQAGITSFLGFLALVSVSLGVLNLLPVPMLDGGHLMYYLWESVTGKPVSEAWIMRLQQAGMLLLLGLMGLALFNDLSRWMT